MNKTTSFVILLLLCSYYSSSVHAQEEINTLTQDDLITITGNVQRPNGIIELDGKLYIACSGDWTVYEVDLETQTTVTYIYGVRNSHTMLVEDTSSESVTIWAPDFVQNSLLRVNPVRSPETIATNLEGPWGIATLDQDTFLVTSTDGNRVLAINKAGNVLPIATELRSPTGIAVKNNRAYFANSGSARRAIEWLDLTDAGIRQAFATPESLASAAIDITPAPLVSGLQNVTSVIIGPDDLLYFAYSLGTRGAVGRVDPELCIEEGCTNDQVEIVLYTELTAPLAGLTISPDMLLYTHTMFRPEIYQADLKEL